MQPLETYVLERFICRNLLLPIELQLIARTFSSGVRSVVFVVYLRKIIAMSALFATIAVVHLLALMSPGPDFLFVTRTAVSQSRSRAMLGVLGITTGVVFWAGLSILGLQVIFHTVPWLQSFITVAGGLYLIWMGYQLLKSGLSTPAQTSGASAEKGAAGQEEAKGVKTMRHPFLFGLLTNLANPKVVIYFASIFSGLVTPDTSDVVRTTIFAMVILETFLWFGVVALIFGLEPLRRGYRRLCRWIDGLAGVLFVGFGIGLIWSVVKRFGTETVAN